MIELAVESPADKATSIARSLLLVDDDSTVKKSSTHSLSVSMATKRVAFGDATFWWRTDNSLDTLTVNWSNCFYNSFVKRRPSLLYPVRTSSGGLNISHSPLSFDGIKTVNDSGVVAFYVTLWNTSESQSDTMLSNVTLGRFNDGYSFVYKPHESGEMLRADIVATDVFGHKGGDSVFVITDFTHPRITNYDIWDRRQPSIKNPSVCKSAGGSTTRHYSLEFNVLDNESGIDHVVWHVGSRAGGTDVGSDNVKPDTILREKCNLPSCSCSIDGFCSLHDMKVKLESLTFQSYYVTLIATSRSGLTVNSTRQTNIQREDVTIDHVLVNPDSSSSIGVRWSAVLQSVAYTVTVCSKDRRGNCGACVDTKSVSNVTEVTGLSPYTQYVVQVEADVGGGSSSLSGKETIRTLPAGCLFVVCCLVYSLSACQLV